MLTIETLKEYGADTDSGLMRCVNNEAMYLRLVRSVTALENFGQLEDALASGDINAAFQAAHGLKGVVNNLSLTPLSEPVSEITELLRAGKEMDYSGYLDEIRKQKDLLEKLCADE